MQTRKFPRTLQEAFGPYTDNNLSEYAERFEWSPVRIALCVTYAATIVTLVAVL